MKWTIHKFSLSGMQSNGRACAYTTYNRNAKKVFFFYMARRSQAMYQIWISSAHKWRHNLVQRRRTDTHWRSHQIKTCHIDFITARCYAERGYATVSRPSVRSVRLSVAPSVTFRYDFHTGWNTSKIISRLIILRLLLGLTLTWAIWSKGNTPKSRIEWGWGHEHKNPQYLWNGARYDQS